MEPDRCLEMRRTIRCELERNHRGPHYAVLDEVSELMWDNINFPINYVEKHEDNNRTSRRPYRG